MSKQIFVGHEDFVEAFQRKSQTKAAGERRYSFQRIAVAEIIRSPHVLVGQSDAGAHLIYDAGFGYATGSWATGCTRRKS